MFSVVVCDVISVLFLGAILSLLDGVFILFINLRTLSIFQDYHLCILKYLVKFKTQSFNKDVVTELLFEEHVEDFGRLGISIESEMSNVSISKEFAITDDKQSIYHSFIDLR